MHWFRDFLLFSLLYRVAIPPLPKIDLMGCCLSKAEVLYFSSHVSFLVVEETIYKYPPIGCILLAASRSQRKSGITEAPHFSIGDEV